MRRVPLTQDTIDDSDMQALSEWIASHPWMTMGPKTREFEKRWAEWIGARHAVFVNSGSSANLIAYAALMRRNSGSGKDGIVVPSFGWSTTVAPAMQFGNSSNIFVTDADLSTWGTCPQSLNDILLKNKIGIVTIAHTIGCPNKMSSIMAMKDDFGFLLLEDTCSSYGSAYIGRKLGTYGDISTFSFFNNHQISTHEGGMVCTNDDDIWYDLLMLRAHGWGRDLPADVEEKMAKKYGRMDFNRRFSFYVPGFNVRPTDIQAFIGLRQMDKIDSMVETRTRNHSFCNMEVERRRLPLEMQHAGARSDICSISIGIQAHDHDMRERLCRGLQDNGVDVRPVVGGCVTKQPFWTKEYTQSPLPMSEYLHDRLFAVPNHSVLTYSDIEYMVDIMEEYCDG
jgi:CDP-4-dehydro-6-deoxyglucose reductase, E1